MKNQKNTSNQSDKSMISEAIDEVIEEVVAEYPKLVEKCKKLTLSEDIIDSIVKDIENHFSK